MVISFDKLFMNLAGFVVFLAVLAVAILILVKIGRSVFRRLRNADVVVKSLTIVGLLLVLFVVGIAMFWAAMFALFYVSGTSSIH